MFATLDKIKLAEGANLIELLIGKSLYANLIDVAQASGILLVFTCLI